MRQIFLDTETTGLEPRLGHRIVEVAAVEMSNRQLTGRHFHYYLNPGRESDPGALQVHGLTADFLKDKQKFAEVTSEFLAFIDNAELIIHNAPFDVAFLNHELGLAKLNPVDEYCATITDTLKMAKELHPGKRNNLDALCERYQIDHSKRTLHGALLDAELLAEVYLAMTRGQESLLIELETNSMDSAAKLSLQNLELIVLPASQEEMELHLQQLEKIERESNGQCLWKRLDSMKS
ncbi:MAG: DNA polymerase III subunit epsilon [Nitrosomonas sp.]|nr:DNA polymerase III subunit epsilon [Nitrosomonas sp.]MDP1951841.1 DNA polymerase III subunit epsilon [Nitrosomonas sp.]